MKRIGCILLLAFAGCTAPMAPPPMPPMPLGLKPMRATSAPPPMAANLTASVVSTNAQGYGLVATVPLEHEDGTTSRGVYLQWNNWPVGVPYVIERSADLVTWIIAFESEGDSGRMLLIADPKEKIETFRIRAKSADNLR